MNRPLLTADDVADELRVSRSRAYGIIRSIAGGTRCTEAEFAAYLESVTVRPRGWDDWPDAGGGVVYFVQAITGGPIKIGFSRDVATRLGRLQIGNPEELRVLAQIHADGEREGRLHFKFRALWIRGEWFAPGPELLEYIGGLA